MRLSSGSRWRYGGGSRAGGVEALFNATDPDDYLLYVAVPDMQHLRAFVLDRLGERDEIAHLHTSLIFEHQMKAAVTPIGSHQDG